MAKTGNTVNAAIHGGIVEWSIIAVEGVIRLALGSYAGRLISGSKSVQFLKGLAFRPRKDPEQIDCKE